jgi:hypothetical protein
MAAIKRGTFALRAWLRFHVADNAAIYVHGDIVPFWG